MPHFYRNYGQSKMRLSGDFSPRKVFLGEGDAEAFFLESLFTRRGFDESEYCVFCFRGIANLGPTLHFLKEEPNFHLVSAVGIMLDANNDHDSRLKSVLSNLRNIGCADESTTFHKDNITAHNGLRLGVFVSPGDSQHGTIATLAIREIQTKRENECLENLRACIDSRCGEAISDKALTQIYISLKKPRLCGTGRGFEAGVLDVEHPAYGVAVRTFTEL